MDLAEITKRFTYHPPQPGQPARYESIRYQAKELAIAICTLTPPSREQSLALTALEEAVFWANAAIARNEGPDIPGEGNMTPYKIAGQPPDPNTLYPDVLTTEPPQPQGQPGEDFFIERTIKSAFKEVYKQGYGLGYSHGYGEGEAGVPEKEME